MYDNDTDYGIEADQAHFDEEGDLSSDESPESDIDFRRVAREMECPVCGNQDCVNWGSCCDVCGDPECYRNMPHTLPFDEDI